jgi:hypothetical protein
MRPTAVRRAGARPAHLRLPLAAAGVAALLAACGGDAALVPTPSPTVPTTATVVPMGSRIDTAKGTIVVHSYEEPASAGADEATPFPGDAYAAIDVEACGGANADRNTGIVPSAFHLEIGHFVAHPADHQVRQPVLETTQLAAGHCARGWITFEIPQGARTAFVIFTGTKVVAWRVT